MTTPRAITLALVFIVFSWQGAQAQSITIDDFSCNQSLLRLTAPGDVGNTIGNVESSCGASVLGTERDVTASMLGGSVNTLDVIVFGGEYNHSQGATITGTSTVVWDGPDGDFNTIDYTGLGGVDLTNGGLQDAFLLVLVQADLNAVLHITVYTDASNASTRTISLPGGANNLPFVIPYNTFTTSLGSGANFTNVGAVTLQVDGSGTVALDVIIDRMQTTQAADLVAVKSNNAGGAVNVGQTFQWSITVTNNGDEDATFQMNNRLLRDQLPTSGATYGTPTVTPSAGVTGTGSIDCSISSNTINCIADSGTVVIPGGESFTVTVNVTPTAQGTLTNPRGGGICRTDDLGVVAEGNEGNNDCSDTVSVSTPDLSAAKTDNTGGSITVGGTFQWTVTVNSNGPTTATFQSGQTILRDQLPTSGATYGTPSVTPSGVSGTGTIGCSISSNTLTCTASGGTVDMPNGSSFAVAFDVTATAVVTLTNPRSGGICRVDPNGVISENNENNNNCADSVTVGGPDLIAEKTNDAGGPVNVGSVFQWTVTVTNNGPVDATFNTGTTILTDNLPSSGATYGAPTISPSGVGGTGSINCSILNNSLTCTASGGTVVMPNGSSFTVSFSVTVTALDTLANPRSGGICRVDPNGTITEGNESNNDCSDSVPVNGPDVRAAKDNDVGGTIPLGSSFQWTVTVTNTGAGTATFNDGVTIFSDNLPGAATYGSPTVGNISGVTGTVDCSINSTLACVANGTVIINGSGGTFSVTFDVTPTVPGDLTNPASTGICRTDPNDVVLETNEGNNDCSDTVTVEGPDLVPVKTNDTSGPVDIGDTFQWAITVTNNGSGTAFFDDGATIFIDNLPDSGVTYGALNFTSNSLGGPGTILCTLSGSDLSCVASGGSLTMPSGASFSVTINALVIAFATLENPRSGGLCQADPNSVIPEENESNNDCTDTVIVNPTGEIRGFKWLDLDANGSVSSNEPFLGGVTIILTGTDVLGNDVNLMTVTDNQGHYLFTDIFPGTYTVCEVPPDVGFVQTFPVDGPICPDGTIGWTIVLGSAEVRQRVKFGNTFDEALFEPLSVHSVRVLATSFGISFFVLGQGIKEINVHVFDLSGRPIYTSGWQANNLSWSLLNGRGQRVARGVYLYVITVRGHDNEIRRTKLQKLIVK